ncbi:MAG: hypothetical protein NVSMB2_09880 [Chloroflexota bacterium]
MAAGLTTVLRIVVALLVFEVVLTGVSLAMYVVGVRAIVSQAQGSFGLVGLAVAELATIIALLLTWRWLNGRPLAALGLRQARIGPLWLRGAAVGALLMGFVILFWYTLVDGATWEINPDLPHAALAVFAGFIGYLVQGPAEEILFRGHVFENVRRRWGVPWAVGISSLLFGLFHSLNPDFGLVPLGNLILFGIATALYKVYVDHGQLWGVFAIHSVWNWLQQVVFGLPNSGVATSADNALFTVTPNTNVPAVIWGGGFGPEGTLATTLVLLALIAYCLRRARRLYRAVLEAPTRPRPAGLRSG